MRSSPASLGFFTYLRSGGVEISEKWISYLHCSMSLLWYSLFPLERCLVHSRVLRCIHFHFQFSFISHPSPGCYKHTLSANKKPSSPAISSQNAFQWPPAGCSKFHQHTWGRNVTFQIPLPLLHHLKQPCSFSYLSTFCLQKTLLPSSPLFNRDMVYCPLSSPSQFLFSISTG